MDWTAGRPSSTAPSAWRGASAAGCSPRFLQKIGFEAAQKLRERVAAEIKTTFASTYTKEVSLAEALRLEEIAVYSKQATGQKYLINPNKGL